MKKSLLYGLCLFTVLMFSQAVSAGDPIDTGSTGLFAYHQLDNDDIDIQQLYLDSSVWNCAGDNGHATFVDAHYVEGNVCLNAEVVGISPESGGTGYEKVKVRVKTDGWIMAYLHPYSSYPHIAGQLVWNKDRDDLTGSNRDDFRVTDFTLGKALEAVMGSTYINEAYDRRDISYWHFQHTDWNKIRIFGNGMYKLKSTDDDISVSASEYIVVPELTISYGMGKCNTGTGDQDGHMYFTGSGSWDSGCPGNKMFHRADLTAYLNDAGQFNSFEPRDRNVNTPYANTVYAAIFAIKAA